MVNLIVGFPIGRRPSIFIDVAMWNIVLLTLRFLDVAKFTNLTPLSLLISCKLSFPIVGLKMSSLPTLALKSPNTIFWQSFGQKNSQFLAESECSLPRCESLPLDPMPRKKPASGR
jgi:hypothetical protein